MNDLELAAPSSALGKLQRGRGAGWIEAVERSDGRELLVTCLAADPRWDSQVEDRASYYAELCIALAVPAIHIDPQGLKDDDARWLRFDVLAKWPDATTRRRSQFCRTTYVPALTPTRSSGISVTPHDATLIEVAGARAAVNLIRLVDVESPHEGRSTASPPVLERRAGRPRCDRDRPRQGGGLARRLDQPGRMVALSPRALSPPCRQPIARGRRSGPRPRDMSGLVADVRMGAKHSDSRSLRAHAACRAERRRGSGIGDAVGMCPLPAQAQPCIVRLVGVYDADGTVRGELAYWVGARLGRRHCALCHITHGSVRQRPEWKACRAGLPVPFDTYHRNDQPADVRAVAGGQVPVVVAETDEGYVLLLDPQELDACGGAIPALTAAVESAVVDLNLAWPT